MIDFEAVRRAYYSPPPPNEHDCLQCAIIMRPL